MRQYLELGSVRLRGKEQGMRIFYLAGDESLVQRHMSLKGKG